MKNICHSKMGTNTHTHIHVTSHSQLKWKQKVFGLSTECGTANITVYKFEASSCRHGKSKREKKITKIDVFLKMNIPFIIQLKLKPYKWIEICIGRQWNSMIKWHYRGNGLRLFWVTLSFTHSSSFSLLSFDPLLLWQLHFIHEITWTAKCMENNSRERETLRLSFDMCIFFNVWLQSFIHK